MPKITVVFAGWDSGSYGPREQDMVPTIRHRFGSPAAEWEQW